MALLFDETEPSCNGECDKCVGCDSLILLGDSIRENIVIHKLTDRRYVSYFDKDHEGGETVEICGYKTFRLNQYRKEELYKIINLKVGEVTHFIAHPKLNMEHHFIMRVMDCGGFDDR